MKKYETRTEEVERKYLVSHTCDLCGRKAGDDDWCSDSYERSEVTISIEEGEYYPEGGSAVETEFDICPDCFKNKLIPWFESQGVKPETKKIDF